MTKKISAWAMFVRAFIVTLFAGSTATQAQDTSQTDDAAWAYAISVGTPTAIRDYLRSFPNGAHLDQAVRQLLSLGELKGTSNGGLPMLQPANERLGLY